MASPGPEIKSSTDVAEKSIASDIPSSEDSVRSEDLALDRFGYKAELQRRFGFWSMLGLSCTIMVTWEGWFVTAGVSLTDGGLAGAVWGFLFCWVGYSAVMACLAELISMIPTAGGQYHWTYELAPVKWRKFISWITGWQIVVAWQANNAAVTYLVGTMVQSLAILNYPDYEPQRWQAVLIMWAIIALSLVFNTVLVKLLPFLEGMVLLLHVATYLVVLVPLVYFGPHASPKDVFGQLSALGGYSPGVSFFVGLLTTVFAFLGADGAIHMCEEVKGARTAVPHALIVSSFINGLLGFGLVIAVAFTIGDVASAVETVTGYAFIDYFARALDSVQFATALTSILMVMFFSACIAIFASTTRVTWAFARDDGLPGSSWIKKVSPSSRLPLPSIVLTCIITFLLSFIDLGSSVAFNAFVSLVVAAFYASYAVPIALLAWKRATGQPLEFGPWKLGKFGLPLNIVSVLYLTVTWVFSFFPIAIPVTLETMNWSCVLLGGAMVLGTVWYFVRQRYIFTGPSVVMGHLDVH